MPGDPPPSDRTDRAPSLAIYDRPGQPKITGIEVIAFALTALWLLGALIFFLVVPRDAVADRDGLWILMMMLAVLMPVGMIWVAGTAARSSRIMREESQRLQAAIDAIRQAYVAQQQRASIAPDPAMTRKLDEIATAARKTESALATFSSRRPEPRRTTPAPRPAPDPAADQPALALGTPAEALAPPLAVEDFIRALNFPETAEDTEGFAALRRALKDRRAAQLIQASQDVLTLLSQEGIYMDDLKPDMARPEVWRQFAQGARGREVAGLGGVRDRSSLALTAGRMKQDPIFRDAAHHFLRKFDHMFAEFEPEASDSEISALGDTRTARAFMLLGRVAGTFD
jgi:hypothetical protein